MRPFSSTSDGGARCSARGGGPLQASLRRIGETMIPFVEGKLIRVTSLETFDDDVRARSHPHVSPILPAPPLHNAPESVLTGEAFRTIPWEREVAFEFSQRSTKHASFMSFRRTEEEKRQRAHLQRLNLQRSIRDDRAQVQDRWCVFLPRSITRGKKRVGGGDGVGGRENKQRNKQTGGVCHHRKSLWPLSATSSLV